jgi:hypothetical protein
MNTRKNKKNIIFWYHFFASFLIIATLFVLATFFFLKTKEGVIAWEVYPFFSFLIIIVFFGDWFFSRDECDVE